MQDDEFINALRAAGSGDFTVTGVRRQGDRARVEFLTPRDGRRWLLLLPLPSSPAPKPWQYTRPDDAADSVGILGVFLDEEILTGAITSARGRAEGGATLVELDSYGLRTDDEREHARRSASADERDGSEDD